MSNSEKSSSFKFTVVTVYGNRCREFCSGKTLMSTFRKEMMLTTPMDKLENFLKDHMSTLNRVLRIQRKISLRSSRVENYLYLYACMSVYFFDLFWFNFGIINVSSQSTNLLLQLLWFLHKPQHVGLWADILLAYDKN